MKSGPQRSEAGPSLLTDEDVHHSRSFFMGFEKQYVFTATMSGWMRKKVTKNLFALKTIEVPD